MPVTREEQNLRIQRLGGQSGRPPIGSIAPGKASMSEGAFHHADFLTRARGTKKLTRAPVPASCYQLRGAATGILRFPAVRGYDSVWISTPGANRAWGLNFWFKPESVGLLEDTVSGVGRVVLATAAQVGTHPDGGSDIDSLFLSLVAPGGVYTLRATWGTDEYDIDLENSGTPFVPGNWLHFSVIMRSGATTSTLEIEVAQWGGGDEDDVVSTASFSQAESKGWIVEDFFVGGAPAPRAPIAGLYKPCHGSLAQFAMSASTNSTSLNAELGATAAVARKVAATVATATALYDYWYLTEDAYKPVSAAGREAMLYGGNCHRAAGITTAQDASLEFNGSGVLAIERAERLRETPKARSEGGVEGHFLELPDWTFGFWFKAKRRPWRDTSVERATLACWQTPYATNLGGGVASDPLIGTYPDNNRPSEHLRVEIIRDGTTYYLQAFFGELEPNSLKHPTGTAGGQTTTAWPPALSTAGEPPATWNKPQDDPTAAHADADGKAAFQVELGEDGDATHPMDYGWLVFLQRHFDSQGSGSNACSVWVRRVTTAGANDTGFGEASDANADSGERHPANQSCFAAARLNGSDICFRADSYVLSLGGEAGTVFGEERMSYDSTNRDPTGYPVDDAVRRFQFSDEGDCFPFCGQIASPFFIRAYLTEADRDKIAASLEFGDEMRAAFAESFLMSMNFREPAGTLLRDGRGNNVSHAERIGLAAITNDQDIERPQAIGAFPRPEPPWHNAADLFADEYGAVNGIVQRIDSGGAEEIYVIAQAGLYEFDRDDYSITRVATLPGQGGPGQASAVVDNNDIIHIAGGKGRPVVVSREGAVAISGIDPPHYSAPQAIVYGNKSVTGGLSITFQTKSSQTLNALIGFEIDDSATMGFAIGYWSDVLRARSRPGGIVTVRYVSSQFSTPPVTSPPTILRYRVLVSGLPPPRGPNAGHITHWEIWRTDANGQVLLLEKRVPISSETVAVLIGDQRIVSSEEADFFRSVPPEGMKSLAVFGDRMIGVAPPEEPRAVRWTKRRDSMNWPPLYSANLNQTNAPATGCVIRRGRAFPFSVDHLYQLIESTIDASVAFGQMESLSLDTVAEGVGGLSHHAAITDHENGIYLPGTKSVYLTEGGTFRSLTIENDSAGAAGGDDFSYPGSWDTSDLTRFVSFHDEKLRMVAVCGPSADDSTRIDALCIFYEKAQIAADGRAFMATPECGRLKGIDANCSAQVLNVNTNEREVWIGTQLGYVMQFGLGTTLGVDYVGLDDISPKIGYVMAVVSSTELRLEASLRAYPDLDVLRGALLRFYRDGELVFTGQVTTADRSLSWVDIGFASAHGVLAGDEWTAGAIPLDWRSGKIDRGDLMTDFRLQSADLTMNE